MRLLPILPKSRLTPSTTVAHSCDEHLMRGSGHCRKTRCGRRLRFRSAGFVGCAFDPLALEELVVASSGHPYLMQLQGCYLVDMLNRRGIRKSYQVTEADINEVMPSVLEAYDQRALKPLVRVMPRSEREYLRSMAECLDETRRAKTRDIADKLGKSQQQLSTVRKSLMENGIVAPGGGVGHASVSDSETGRVCAGG